MCKYFCFVYEGDKNILNLENKVYVRKIYVLEMKGFRMNNFLIKRGKKGRNNGFLI